LKITGSYKAINASGNAYYKLLVGWLYKNVLNAVIRRSQSNSNEGILLREDLIKFLPNQNAVYSYEGLYNKHLNEIDTEELSRLVDQLIIDYTMHTDSGEILRAIRIYLFGPYFGKWCQMVEFAKRAKERGERNVFYVGRKSDPEYQIFSTIISDGEVRAESVTTFSDISLYLLSKIKARLNNSKTNAYGGFKTHPKSNSFRVCAFQKNIVIAIQEERRFKRISILCKEFEENDCGVV